MISIRNTWLTSIVLCGLHFSAITQVSAQGVPMQTAAPSVSYPMSNPPANTYIQPNTYVMGYGPTRLHYEEGKPTPQGYHLEEKPRLWMVITGSILFGVTYLPTSIFGAAGLSNRGADKSWPLMIPAIGPFIATATIKTVDANGLLIWDGILQTAGISLLILGLTLTEKSYVRNDIAKSNLFVAPMVSSKVQGLSLVGRF